MTSQRPSQLTAIAIIAIVLGGMGILGGFWGVAGALFQGPMMDAQRRMVAQGGGEGAPEAAFYEHVEEVTRTWMPITLTHQGLNIVASGLLLAMGILLLRWNPLVLRWLKWVVGANVLVDVGGGVATSLLQMRMLDGVTAMMPANQAPQGEEFGRFFDAMMLATGWVTACFTALWVLLKIVFYLWALSYLKRPDVRAMFRDANATGRQTAAS